ncbi:uncharacterized protein LOC143254951 [Tachypleus tridentatus]|uniref:uncharacterized protein LOC143254951 n=1 Tax=Tachypleus tridentatus TaxID=6853 RepID=UPI003FD14DB2
MRRIFDDSKMWNLAVVIVMIILLRCHDVMLLNQGGATAERLSSSCDTQEVADLMLKPQEVRMLTSEEFFNKTQQLLCQPDSEVLRVGLMRLSSKLCELDLDNSKELYKITKEKLSSKTNKVQPIFKALRQNVVTHLGDPRMWTAESFTTSDIQDLLLTSCPNILMNIQNESLIQNVITASSGQNIRPETSAALSRMKLRMYGDPEMWNSTYLTNKINDIFQNMLPCQVAQINSSAILGSLSKIGTVRKQYPAIARAAVGIAVNVKDKSSNRSNLLSSLGDLRPFLSLTDMKSLDLNKTQIMDVIQEKKNLGYELTMMEKRMIFTNKTEGNVSWSSDTVKQLDSIINCVPESLLNDLTEKDLLSKDMLLELVQNERNRKYLGRKLLHKLRGEKWTSANLRQVPPEVIKSISSIELNDMDSNVLLENMDRINMVEDLDPSQAFVILKKLREDKQLDQLTTLLKESGKNITAFMANMLPANKLASLDISELEKLQSVVSGSSILLVQAVIDKYRNKNITTKNVSNILTDIRYLPRVPCRWIESINASNVMNILESISSQLDQYALPQQTGCLSMKLKEYLQMMSENRNLGEQEILNFLSPGDVFAIGGAIVASTFSEKAIRESDKSMRNAIFTVLANMKANAIFNIQPKQKRQSLARAALENMGATQGKLTDGQVLSLGNLLLSLHPSEISRIPPETLEMALNTLKMSGYGDELCFDPEMSDSIRKQLQKVHGMTITGVRCLGCFLMTMNEEELSQIPDDVLADVSKDLSSCWNDMLEMSESMKMGLCMAEITEDERNTLMNQKKRLWKRVNQAKRKVTEDMLKEQTSDYRSKRETSRLTCSIIEATGSVAGFSVAELQTLSENEVQMCFYLLGKDKLEERQIEVLWSKVKMAYGSVSNLSEDKIILLGYLTKGLSEMDINELSLTAASIEELGKYWDLSESQLKCLANQTKQALGRYLSNYVSTQLTSLGHILCGMSKEDIISINDNVFRESVSVLGQLQKCSSEVVQTLAQKATKTTGYGSPSEWSSAIMYSLGGLIAGLSAEELKTIPAESMEGITPQAVSVLEPEVIKFLTTPQLSQLSYNSLAAITSDQLKQLSPEQQQAIYSARYRSSDLQDNGYNELAGTLSLVIGAFLVVYYKPNTA